MRDKTILLVEDNDKFRRLTKLTLQKEGYIVLEAASGSEAKEQISSHVINIVILDILLPDTTGLKLLEKWKTQYSNISFIICTAYGDVEDAVQAMKIGAFDYLTKPIKADELKVVIERAFQWNALHEQNKHLKQAVQEQFHLHGMIGKSETMQEVFELIERVAPQDITVLLQGESGTGKSRCARALHLESKRRDEPFIQVNCATIPNQLLESELFGYEKGAFTGATHTQQGKCTSASGGTLFLDEIGEIPLDLQAKLLQFTQDKTFTPLGSAQERKVDVRIIAATNRNLWDMVQEGTFREDLYYRLNIIGIELPSLRKRKEDISGMIDQFLGKYSKEYNREYTLPKPVLKILTEYPWPGNIRELQNALARATVLSSDGKLRMEDFPEEVSTYIKEKKQQADSNDSNFSDSMPWNDQLSLPKQLEQIEQSAIEQAVQKANGNQAQAAEQLGISRQSLLYKIRKYNIDTNHFD